MRKAIYGELLEVGDVLEVTNLFGTKKLTITRVSATLSFSKIKSGDERRFKRVVGFSMSHPYEKFSTIRYRAFKND